MNIASTGKRGLGKTSLSLYMARQAPLRVFFDPTPNRGSFPRRAHQQSYGATPDGARAAIATLGAIDEDAADELVIDEVLIAPSFELEDTFEATCESLIDWLGQEQGNLSAPGVAFVVDEVWMVAGRQMPPAFDYLARCGDRAVLQLIVTAHNPQDVPVKLRPIVDYWAFFQTTDNNALDVIEERTDATVREAVQGLGPREYLLWDDARRTADIRRNAALWRPTPASDRLAVA